MIEVNNINISYLNKTIFNNAKIKIFENEVTVIKGKSGSGKTSLFYLLGLISSNTDAVYKFNGNQINLKNEDMRALYRKKEIGYIFQEKNLYEDLTIKDNLYMYCTISGIEFNEKLAIEILDKVHLKIDINESVSILSGGQRQRLAIACALIKKPSLIIADEPTSSLDEKNKIIIFDLFKELARDGKMVIIASHDNSILKYADRIYTIESQQLKCVNKIDKDTKQIKDIENIKLDYNFFSNYLKLKNKAANKVKKIMTLFISICITVGCFSTLLKDGMILKYSQSLNKIGSHEIVIQKNSGVFLEKDLSNVHKFKDIADIYPVYETDLFQITVNQEQKNYPVKIFSYYDHQFDNDSFNLINDNGEIVLTSEVYKNLNLSKTDLITIENKDYLIKGILEKDFENNLTFEKNIIFIPIRDFKNEPVRKYILNISNIEDFEGLSDRLNIFNQDYTIYFPDNNYQETIRNIEVFSNNINIFTSILLFIITLLVCTYQIFETSQKKYEICILKVNGLSNKEIINMTIVQYLYKFINLIISIIFFSIIFTVLSFVLLKINIDLLSFKYLIKVIIFVIVVQLIPTFISTIQILQISPEKLLRN